MLQPSIPDRSCVQADVLQVAERSKMDESFAANRRRVEVKVGELLERG
jgi:hypothetical protein